MPNATSKKLYFLISIFIVGFLSLFLLNQLFASLVHNLDRQIINSKSKMQIGEFIAEDLLRVQSLFFELETTTTSKKSREIIKNRINSVIKNIDNSLNVLEHGGTFKKLIKLNLDGKSSFTKKINYVFDKEESIPLVVIDVRPKLIEFQNKMKTLDVLLDARYEARKNKNDKAYFQISRKIRRFYKTAPAFFTRTSENIRRLLYENSIELERIKRQIEEEKQTYTKIKIALIIFVLLIVLLIGSKISKNITNDNAKLLELNENLEAKKQSIRAILDGQENIVIVTDGEKMVEANDALTKFFRDFNSVEEFMKEHDCVCDFFLPNPEDPNYLLNADYDGHNWIEHIWSNPNINFKALMSDGKINHHFSVSANKKVIDSKGNFIVVVSLNDISDEIKTREKLQKLNNNLQEIVQEELEKNRAKDKQMMQQSRLAQMGEMISMIAHQWRQPLSAISATSAAIHLKAKLKRLDEDIAIELSNKISNYSQHLSQTIDDFREFFKPNKVKVETDYTQLIKSVLDIVQISIENKNIELKSELHCEDKFLTYPNEIKQVVLNLIKNAEDVLLEKEIPNPYIKIKSFKENGKFMLEVSDNAGGIPENIIDKIFDPYFSTKTKKDGTGLGLYMSKTIIEEHCNGKLNVKNDEFGAVFTIEME